MVTVDVDGVSECDGGGDSVKTSVKKVTSLLFRSATCKTIER